MNSTQHTAQQRAQSPAHTVGTLLRSWRDTRGKSQLELSFETGISQRHISFIESARSVPGRQLLLDLADALDIPLRDRNTLLLAAGYAPMYADVALDAPEMQPVMKALERMLRQHEPFPAIVMDRYWNVLSANASTPRFFNAFIDMAARQHKGSRNMLHLLFDPEGMRPFIANWPAVAQSLIQRVHRESVGRVIDEQTKELLQSLLAYPDTDPALKKPQLLTAASANPVIPISFVKDGEVLSYFSMLTTVGTPQTIAAQEMRIECMFPADDATELAHARLLETDGPGLM